MAHIIDITARLTASIPKIKIGEKEYDVNDNKNTVIKVQNMLTSSKDDDSSFDSLIKAVEMLLGKKAVVEIEKEMPGTTTRISQLKVLFVAIMALVEGVDYEVVEARFQGPS